MQDNQILFHPHPEQCWLANFDPTVLVVPDPNVHHSGAPGSPRRVGMRTGYMMRQQAIAAVYAKVLRLNSASIGDVSAGKARAW